MMDTLFRYVGVIIFDLLFFERSPREKLNQPSNNTYDENYDIGGQEDE